jgi:hypothetical protein
MGMFMSMGGLVVTLVVVGFAILTVVRVFGGLRRTEAERQRLLREGIQASARLLAVQMGGMTMTVGVSRHLQLRLQVEVQPPGRPPYQAMMTVMVSELQIPQLQPGALLTVRIDPRDGSKLALEGVGSPGAAAYGGAPAGYGPPGMGAPPPYGAPAGPYGAPAPYGAPVPYGEPGMVPIGGLPRTPAGAKIGLWIGLAGGLVGIIVAVVVVLVNVGGVGLGSASEGDSVCAQAVRCCEAAAKGNASAANCKNLGKIGVPASACQSSLDSFRQAAKSQGRTCP